MAPMSEPEKIYPVRSVNIEGVSARALFLIRQPIPPPDEVMSVREADDIDKALGDEGNEHLCPLCNEYFGTAAFRAHAQACINIYAPRKRIWTPPGFSANAVQHHVDKIIDTDLQPWRVNERA